MVILEGRFSDGRNLAVQCDGGICISYCLYLWIFFPQLCTGPFAEFDESLVRAFANVITMMYQSNVKTAHYHSGFSHLAYDSPGYERMESITPSQAIVKRKFLHVSVSSGG